VHSVQWVYHQITAFNALDFSTGAGSQSDGKFNVKFTNKEVFLCGITTFENTQMKVENSHHVGVQEDHF